MRSATRSTTSSPARAVAGAGGVPLVTFAVALNALLADLVAGTARRSARTYAREVGVADDRGGRGSATVTRAQPPVVGALHVALVQGNDQNRDLTDAELPRDYLPTTTSTSPAGSPTRSTSSCSPSRA